MLPTSRQGTTNTLARPVNDLSRGCSVDDVYKMIAITANQAIAAKEQENK
jgi:phosphate acetyltransferase